MSNNKYGSSYYREKLKKIVFDGEPPCWLCGKAIDYTLPRGFKGSPEMDDIVPVSRGGDPLDPDNLRPAHKLCNQTRQNLPAEVAQRNARNNENKTSRIW